MQVKIYGRDGCPFCTRAKLLADRLSKTEDNYTYEYIDINENNLTKDDLSKMVGSTVTTVPQIFIDEKPVGGCTDFEALMNEQFN